jgi:hypothetical protein
MIDANWVQTFGGDDDRVVTLFSHQILRQLQHRRRLADLPRRVNNKVCLLVDQWSQFRQARRRRQHVVNIWFAWPGSIEKPHRIFLFAVILTPEPRRR